MVMHEQSSDSLIDELLEMRARLESLFGALYAVATRADEAERRARRLADAPKQIKVYTEREAAEALRVSVTTLSKLRVEKSLPHFRPGDRVLYTEEDLRRITEILGRHRTPEEAQPSRRRTA